MNRLVIFLNEMSCQTANHITREAMVGCVLATLATMRAVQRVRRDVLLASHEPIAGLLLGDGTYSLASVLVGDIQKEEWRFILNLDQSSPWAEYPGVRKPGDLEGVNFRGTAAVGMTWARINGSAVLSFGHPPDWNQDFIAAQFEQIDEAENLVSVQVSIPNLSRPVHVESHHEALRNFGSTVSPSSLVHDGHSFVVRMYPYDHNPPHFHVLLHRDTSNTLAKCAIDTLDTLSGHLPPTLRNAVKDWARIHRDDLITSWERCRVGEHPLVLEG